MTKKIICALLAPALLSACGGGNGGGGDTASAPHAVTKATKGASVTLTEFEVTGRPDSSGFIPPAPAGATYVVVTYTIKNTGEEALSLENWPQPRLADAAGHPGTRDAGAALLPWPKPKFDKRPRRGNSLAPRRGLTRVIKGLRCRHVAVRRQPSTTRAVRPSPGTTAFHYQRTFATAAS